MNPHRQRHRKPAPETATPWQRVCMVLALVAFAIPWLVEFPGLSPAGHRVFSVFLLAIVLWVSEAVPLHATAALIILLQILLVSDHSLLPVPAGFDPPAYSMFFHSLAHPVLMLFLGGFFLADGAAKFSLDRNLARVLLRPFGHSPKIIMLGLMLITALLSMFMSNTATTATMMAVVIPVLAGLPREDRMRAGLALSVSVAANVGGIGTPIGTPPNAIALGALAKEGITIGFVQWMGMAIPLMLATLLFAWLAMYWYFPTGQQHLEINIDASFDTSRPALIFYGTFALTVLLWLTETFHGMSSSVVGFIPVVLLLTTRVFTTSDMKSIQWHVLWLVAGGIALGSGVGATGVDRWLVGLVAWDQLPAVLLTGVLALFALVTGSFISHSATANLLVPIGMTLATSVGVAISPVLAGVFIAIGSSLAMAFPISTPPNAIAYSTGAIKIRDMAIIGTLVGAFGWALFVFAGPPLWQLLGVLPS